jgi:hypothetical protein
VKLGIKGLRERLRVDIAVATTRRCRMPTWSAHLALLEGELWAIGVRR